MLICYYYYAAQLLGYTDDATAERLASPPGTHRPALLLAWLVARVCERAKSAFRLDETQLPSVDLDQRHQRPYLLLLLLVLPPRRRRRGRFASSVSGVTVTRSQREGR